MVLERKTSVIKELVELLNESANYVWDMHDRALHEKIEKAVDYANKTIAKEIEQAEKMRQRFIEQSGKGVKNIRKRKISR